MDMDTVPELLGIGSGRIMRIAGRLTKEEKLVIGSVLESPGITVDEAALKTGLSVRDAGMLSTALELKGLLQREGSRLYISK